MKKIKFVFKEKDDIHTFHSAWQMLNDLYIVPFYSEIKPLF